MQEHAQNGLFAIFDGHQGSKAADYCVKHLESEISKISGMLSDGFSALQIGKLNFCNVL